MTGPAESFVHRDELRFRVLTWGSGLGTVLFLHGLSGVADVWGPTVAALSGERRYAAMDLRGHGRSSVPNDGYTAAAMAADVKAVIHSLGAPVHLVGHSMGARLALVLAASAPSLLRSVAIVDIGPEASRRNIEETVRGIDSRPERFASQEEALGFAFRSRMPTESDRAIFLARLEQHADGSLTWRASRSALARAVTSQRSRNYWNEWRRIAVPALYVHGGASNEVSTAIADRMRAENPQVRFEWLEGVGHSIPLIAPTKLAPLLERLWSPVPEARR